MTHRLPARKCLEIEGVWQALAAPNWMLRTTLTLNWGSLNSVAAWAGRTVSPKNQQKTLTFLVTNMISTIIMQAIPPFGYSQHQK
jgi:hypothetical protein